MSKPKIIIDIRFNDGTYKRGIVAHSIDFEPDRYWELRIFINEVDVYNNYPRLYSDVDQVMVVGYLKTEEK